MYDESEVKHTALDGIRKMLKDRQAKRLGGLGKAAPAAMEIHIVKAAAPEGSPEEEHAESPAEASAEGDESAEPGKEEHPLHALVMKRMDQILRPKKG